MYGQERVRRIETKSSSQRVFLVYWNSKNTREGGVQGCRRLAFRLVAAESACPGGHKASCGGLGAESRVRHHPLAGKQAGRAGSLAACRSAWSPSLLRPAASSQGFLDQKAHILWSRLTRLFSYLADMRVAGWRFEIHWNDNRQISSKFPKAVSPMRPDARVPCVPSR